MAEEPDEAEAPLADLVERVDARREREALEDTEGLFEQRPYEELSGESVWTAAEEPPGPDVEAGGEVLEASGRTAVVEKRNFCERCPHFAEPPRASCTNPGTEITAFVDKDHVRLKDCPVVEDRGVLAETATD